MNDTQTQGKLRGLLQRRFEDEADQMVALEQRTWVEIVTRHLFLLVLSIAGAWYYDLVFPVWWIGLYATTTLGSRSALRRLGIHRSLASYCFVVLCFFTRLVVFRSMLVYLWFFPHPAGIYFAFLMLVASARFSVNLKSRVRSYMYMTTLTDLICLAIIAGDFVFMTRVFHGSSLVGFTTGLLMVYYVVTLMQNVSYLDEMEQLEQQTRQAQKMEAVGRLTGGVAHDFNNILTVVMGNLELHEVMTDSDEKKQLLRQTRDAARRAADLTTQLLAFSRQSRLTVGTHDVSDIFEQVEILSDRLLPANIRYQHDAPEDTAMIRADATQLEVALLNLIINARDAMTDGGTLHLKAQNMDIKSPPAPARPGGFVCMEITDTGGGIPENMLDKVAEPFFTTKPVGKGSGLGLSMVKGFAEQSGGFMNIAVEAGKSTTVSICLPAVDPKTETATD